MTLSEFKAWFEGFSEGIDKTPTEKQFTKIKAKVAEITATPTTYPVFVDRWVQPYRRYWDSYWSSAGYGDATVTTLSATAGNLGGVSNADPGQDVKFFDSNTAFRELGRMEALN